MKKLLLFISLFYCSLSFSQEKIGSDISGKQASEFLGFSVSISSDGNIVASGAVGNTVRGSLSGQVRIYENTSGVWSQVGSDISGSKILDTFGASVSLSSDGSIVAIGATGNLDSPGYVRIYKNTSGNWEKIGSDIIGETPGDSSGWSVSLSSDGNIVAIGAPFNDINGTDSGNVRVYKNISDVWTQIGSSINGEGSLDESGKSISLSSDGSIIAIGAESNSFKGHVRVYKNISGIWTQIGSDIEGGQFGDKFGASVSLSSDGNTVAIGAPSALNTVGQVLVYTVNKIGVWTQTGSSITGEATSEEFGTSVSLSSDGNTLVAGTPFHDFRRGRVKVYKKTGDWTQIGSDIEGESGTDQSGWRVDVSSNGDIIVIGERQKDGINGVDSGAVRVFNFSDALLSSDSFVLENTSMYPNPTKKEFTVRLSENIQFKKLRIYTTLGKYLLESSKKEVNIESLSKGVYFVEITTDQGKATKKLLVN